MDSELVKILEEALFEGQESDNWFEEYQKTNIKSFWNESIEHYAKCRGLLKAYQIITGKNVRALVLDIREELETLKEETEKVE